MGRPEHGYILRETTRSVSFKNSCSKVSLVYLMIINPKPQKSIPRFHSRGLGRPWWVSFTHTDIRRHLWEELAPFGSHTMMLVGPWKKTGSTGDRQCDRITARWTDDRWETKEHCLTQDLWQSLWLKASREFHHWSPQHDPLSPAKPEIEHRSHSR